MKKVLLEKHFISLSKDSIIYGLGNIVLKVLGLATTPIITRIFTPADYGVINLISSIISFLGLIMIFGMDSAMSLSFFEYKKNRKIVISSGFWFLLIWAIVVMTLATIFSNSIANFFLKSEIYTGLLIIGFVTAILNLLIGYITLIFRLEFKAKTFAIITVINAVFSTSFILLFVAGFHFGLKGYFIGSMIGSLIAFLVAFYLARSNFVFKISKLRLLQMISYGSMLLPASMATYIFDLSDRFFVSHYWNLQELGFYSMAFNITAMMTFFSVALSQAWSPFIYKMYHENHATYKHFLSRFASYYLIFFAFLTVMFCTFNREVLAIFTTPKFFGATVAVIPLAIAAFFSASIRLTVVGISISRKTKYIATYTIITALFNILLNFLLIPKYGIAGAGWATAISYFLLTALYFQTSQKLIPFEVDWKKMIKLAILTSLAIFIMPLSWKFGFWENFAIKITELVAYLILLYFSGVIEKGEVTYLKQSFAKMKLKAKNKFNNNYEN